MISTILLKKNQNRKTLQTVLLGMNNCKKVSANRRKTSKERFMVCLTKKLRDQDVDIKTYTARACKYLLFYALNCLLFLTNSF